MAQSASYNEWIANMVMQELKNKIEAKRKIQQQGNTL